MSKTKTCKRCKADFQHKDLEQFTICEQCELEGDYATCVECEKEFFQDTDIQLCDKCMSSFDVDKLWSMHDLEIYLIL